MVFCIDNGHGINTKGKQSVDGSLKEYAWTREVAQRVYKRLLLMGYKAVLVTPETTDVPLSTRVERVNAQCRLYGSQNVCCVSIHVNADGYGKEWTKAQGWSVHVSRGRNGKVSHGSEMLADCMMDEALKLRRKVRRMYTAKSYWIQSLAMTRDTLCPAVLTENFFMTNECDLRFLNSERGTEAIAQLHINALIEYARQREAEK